MRLVRASRTRVRWSLCLGAGLLAVWVVTIWNDWNAALRSIHWEDGAWRIGWVGQSSGAPTWANGEKRTVDELLGDPRLALD